jgi:hypothetical protein
MKPHGLLLASVILLGFCQPDERPSMPDAPNRTEAIKEEPLPETVSFNDHIQPILSENCYHCHGPDSGTREPKSEPLRLDLADEAYANRDGGSPVMIKGDAAASLLMKLIRSADEDEVMPPPSSHKKLSPRDVSLVERWIDQGAVYQEHWSFIGPVRPEVPAGVNPIDHFINDRLATVGLKPNPPEDARRFFRRLHLDLTGLPPSPESTEEFIAASDPDPIIDALLASPAAAEHQARQWLDAARYADTHGIHIDNYRAIWPYRDWVVDAFAKNMKWDQFTIEQIAGDLLPSPTLEQKIATGFNRCLATTGEGGAISEEYEAIYAKDRVETVSTVWLGLTTGCAACHDHKFDPVSTADFYSMAAFFRNNTMSAMDGNNAEHPPNIFAPLPADRGRWTTVADEIAKIDREIAARKSHAKADFEAWLANAKIGSGDVMDPYLALHLPLNTGESVSRGTVDGKPTEWTIPGGHRDGPLGPALLASAATTDLGDLGAISRGEKVSFGVHIYIEGTPSGAVIARMDPANQHRGWDLWLENGKIGTHFIDRWPDAANKIVAPEPLEPGKWHHVLVTFDGSQASHRTLTLFVNGKPVKKGPEPNTLGQNITGNTSLRIGSRSNGANRLNGTVAIQDFRLYRKLLPVTEIAALSRQNQLKTLLAIPAEQRTEAQTAALLDHYLKNHDAPTLALLKKLAPLTAEQTTLRDRGSVTLIMEEKKDSPATAHILERGVYSSKGALVSANIPVSLPAIPEKGPYNRLDLAEWLLDRGNPLTARVTVNRAWQQFFGTGIVESAGDFGIMGARPTHPKLLDWLAVEFMDSGWDHRHILKLIVTSATYRQSATISPEKLEKDPYNKLLARGPRQRMDAEVVRDMALSASGLLSAKTGGPPVKPYQPEGIWEAVAMPQSNTRSYQEDSGEGLYRRSVYTFWKRTAPPASMEILNAPSREVTCVRRDQTNTPLQALVLLNDPQFVESARQLATYAMKASADPSARLDFITARLLNRTLDAEERDIITGTLTDISATFAKEPNAAAELLKTGGTPADAALPPAELAAWTLLTSQILNLDETVTK